MADAPHYDLLLSHATPDKPWVRAPAYELEALGLKVFLDELEIKVRPPSFYPIRRADLLRRQGPVPC